MNTINKSSGNLETKIHILSSSARFDVCGFKKEEILYQKQDKILKNAIYISRSEGECVPLLKVLYSNNCSYNCAYCINRSSSNIRRASFFPDELALITSTLYRKGVIKGLFLSSSVEENPNTTMEKMLVTVKILRRKYSFPGYIHLKILPNSDNQFIEEGAIYANRLSINVEFAEKENLEKIAPSKKMEDIMRKINYMDMVYRRIREEGKREKLFSGQSTQLIIGGTKETDRLILNKAFEFYSKKSMRRVYYSAFYPVTTHHLLSSKPASPLRELRLYQADFLIRKYNFSVNEIMGDEENLNLFIDPKLGWALRNRDFFPVDILKNDYESLIRVPGIGPETAKKIIRERKNSTITEESLRKMGVKLKKIEAFVTIGGRKIRRDEEGHHKNLFPQEITSQYSNFPSSYL